jgi:hypothetical protein
MRNIYACPHCEVNLNPSVKIVLVAGFRGRKGLILMSPLPGNYRFVCDKTLAETMETGAMVSFYCPVCGADLTAPSNQDFAELHLIGAGRKPRRVQFSRRHGTHATFVIAGEEVAAYGDDSDDFTPTNFFGA